MSTYRQQRFRRRGHVVLTHQAFANPNTAGPGPGYAGNRHNVGAMVLDELAARAGIRLSPGKGGALAGGGG